MENQICTAITKCRICGSKDLRSVLNLGEQYIASIFVDKDIPESLLKPYPLEIVRCQNKDGCGLVQLKHSISPDVLYANYGYRSGTNEIMRANLQDIVQNIEKMIELKDGDIVLDIGCNDGTLLEAYKSKRLHRLGIDPANNVTKSAVDKGFEIIDDYFSSEVFRKVLPNQKAKVITSIAMFYDLENPQKFVEDIKDTLSEDGLWVIELSYLPFMLQNNSFDTVCHEHLEYYSLRQMEWMFEKVGFKVQKVELNDINGGSFRLYVRNVGFNEASKVDKETIERIHDHEEKMRLDSDVTYQKFNNSVSSIKDELQNLIYKLIKKDKKIFIYGASTKGNTILQYCNFDNTLIPKAADRNPDKWGKFTLGTNIPIISEEQARNEKPDYFLILPWHFLKSFLKRELDYLKQDGKFIVPLPKVRIIGKNNLE